MKEAFYLEIGKMSLFIEFELGKAVQSKNERKK